MQLTPREWETIAAALLAVAPSGGGSAPFFLANKVMREQGIENNDALQAKVMQNCKTVVREAVEAGVTYEEMQRMR